MIVRYVFFNNVHCALKSKDREISIDSLINQAAPGSGIKFTYTKVCREIPKIDSEHEARVGSVKFTDTKVCREIEKTDSEHDARAGSVKFTDTKVCREIPKTDSDTGSKPEDSCPFNVGTGPLPVNE